MRSGSIKNSFCIPYSNCLNPDKTFKNNKELKNVFKTYIKNINEKNIVFSCGSGVTACVLALAYSLINDKYHPCIYDGSWAEYGLFKFNMKRSTKVISILSLFFSNNCNCDYGRMMIGNHFKKKFSKIPPPGIIVTECN